MSEFLSEYVKRGLTGIYVTEYDFEEERSGYQNETTTETIVAKKDDGFITLSVHQYINFNPRSGSRDLTIGECIQITKEQYDSVAEGKQPIDTPQALARLQKEQRAKEERQRVQKTLDDSAPSCHAHGKLVVRRNSKTNDFFWGCSKYPDCRTTHPFSAEQKRLQNHLLQRMD